MGLVARGFPLCVRIPGKPHCSNAVSPWGQENPLQNRADPPGNHHSSVRMAGKRLGMLIRLHCLPPSLFWWACCTPTPRRIPGGKSMKDFQGGVVIIQAKFGGGDSVGVSRGFGRPHGQVKGVVGGWGLQHAHLLETPTQILARKTTTGIGIPSALERENTRKTNGLLGGKMWKTFLCVFPRVKMRTPTAPAGQV